MKINCLSKFVVVCFTFFVSSPSIVAAQDVQSVDELQRLIEFQQIMLEKQQEKLEVQQKQLNEQAEFMRQLQNQLDLLKANQDSKETTELAETLTEKPPEKPDKKSEVKPSELSDAGKHDRQSPTSTNVTYFDPTKVINIPGTKTSIGLHGLAEFQIFYDSVGLNNNRFDTASIPVDGGPSQTKFSVNPTQLAISSTTPVTEGRLNTMISMDFNGQLDRPEPRLRIAYGEYVSDQMGIGLLGGQAYSTALDLRAVPETLDFAMPAGLWQTRQPLFRFTSALVQNTIFEAALETPENVVYIESDKLTRWPDLSIAGTLLTGGSYFKHLRISGLIRDLRAEDVSGNEDSALGWAVGGSTKIDLPILGPRDNFKFNIHYGDGYGTQIKGGPFEGAFNPVTSSLETIGIFGFYTGLQHFWSDRFRSNFVYGYVDPDNPEFLDDDTLESTNYAAANLVWSPFDSVTLGVEYLWGRRENKDGDAGTTNRLLFSSKFDF
jgi:hypothetical protein